MKKYLILALTLIILALSYSLYTIYPEEAVNYEKRPVTNQNKVHQNKEFVSKENIKSISQELNPKLTPKKNDVSKGLTAQEIEEISDDLKTFIDNGQPEKIIQHFASARKARADKIQAEMAGQGVDQEWEFKMIQYFELSGSLLPQTKGFKLSNTDCRENICALTVDYGAAVVDYKQIEPYMSNIGNVLGLDAWVHHDAFNRGGVIYLAKENHRLPKIKSI